MIAPLPPSQMEAIERRERLRDAHQLIANTLLPNPSSSSTAPPIAPWKAWLFVAWLAFVVLAYAGSMLGIWR